MIILDSSVNTTLTPNSPVACFLIANNLITMISFIRESIVYPH